MTDMIPADPASPAGGALAEDAGVAAERERLARQLRETRMQLAMTETRLAALEQSSTMKFGRTIANAAKKPWPRGALLPRDLFRLWKDRAAPKSGAKNAATALAAAQLADLSGSGGRFLSSLTAPGVLALADPALTLAGGLSAGSVGTGAGLVITGAISALGCATLAPDAVVHPLLPHDADVLLEGTGADLVLIEAAALLPGAPWAYATDPAAADRGRRLARLIVLARSLGKPVVLIRNVPQSLMPGIGWLAASCDAVIEGGLGVQLARFNPIGLTVARATTPVYAGARDPREAPAVRALLDALTEGPNPAVQLAGDAARSWRALPALYRDHAVFVTASADQAREQAASGARVIGPLGSGTDAGTVRGQLEAVRGGRPAAITDVRSWLREIFLNHATPARLARHRARGRAARRPRPRAADRGAGPGRRRRRGRPAGVGAARPAAAADRGGRGECRRAPRRRPPSARRWASSPTTTSGSSSRPRTPAPPSPDQAPPTRPGLGAAARPAGGRAVAGAMDRGPLQPSVDVPARPGLRAGVRPGGRGRVRHRRVRVHPLAGEARAGPVGAAGPRRPERGRLGQPRAAAIHDHRLSGILQERSDTHWPDHDHARWSTVTST